MDIEEENLEKWWEEENFIEDDYEWLKNLHTYKIKLNHKCVSLKFLKIEF